MIKLFLCAVIISGFSFIGISLSKNERKDLKITYALILFFEHAEREITHNRSSFDNIVSSFEPKEKAAKPFFDIITNKKSDMTPGEKLKEAVSALGLNEVIKQMLSELAGAFGKYDAETQAKKIRQIIESLTSEYERRSADITARSKLYRSVSAFLGIAAAIILY